MPRLIVLYPTPSDAQDFEKLYHEEHEPLVRAQLSSLRSLTASAVAPLGGGESPYYWMAELSFDSIEELTRAMASDGGLRAGAHARQISSGGAPLMLVVADAAVPAGQPSA